MEKNCYSYEELISCGKGDLFGEGNAKLPLPPMLMFDRITETKQDIGDFKKGFIKAEIYTVTELENYTSELALKNAGKIRQEGKEYVVKDGDIIFFKFNV